MSRTVVADAAAALHEAITTAEQLITQPDTTPAGAIGEAAGSAPPWNAAAAYAADVAAHAGPAHTDPAEIVRVRT